MVSRYPSGICLCLLCGLPASGKSTISNSFKKENGRYFTELGLDLLHIEFDKILRPTHPQFCHSDKTFELQDSLWKKERTEIITLIYGFIKNIKATNEVSTFATMVKPGNVTDAVWCKFSKILTDHVCTTEHSLVLLLDDNMFLHSMRYEYYKVARESHIGFCEIFMNASVESALERNRLRDDGSRVPDEVITKMATKLEIPRKSKFHWEKNNLLIDSDAAMDVQLHAVTHLITEALAYPVEPIPEVDEEEKVRGRHVCSVSVLHQIDIILRRCVSFFMAVNKPKKSPQEMQQLSKQVLHIKEKIHKDFRMGNVIPDLYEKEVSVQDAAKDTNSVLYQMVFQLFQSEIMRLEQDTRNYLQEMNS